MACSINFRRKVLEIKERDGLSFEKTALYFGASESSVFRWSKRLEPCLTRNKPTTKIDMEAIRAGCSQRGVGEALKRLKITIKNALSSESL